ncbi:Holliday junction branch migration protein RuvA [Nitrogeniibacter mangrovi]|uniref:Holliday junction branch migration complex subunit RuvA n=1 Tax=Nitrogeniibacter mangrovi TaxID=2016596 RepID=A0A6C1AZ52_9RHOO|nr:Holliday junction branch migration protein RuvA [Nitrogeniibacter mangrovi]QID16626.1 Holliday junction branch migration protein RuvA [Nitrogeniibacter mangrovi]
MIGRLTGTLLEKNPPQILVDVGGIGYEVDVPMSTFYQLPAIGQSVTLRTHLAVREDGHFLYGFFSDEERAAFRQLIKVSGIGARTALAVLSGLSVNDLAQAVALQETGRIVKVPGIGKKTAERLVLELKDKLGKALPATGATVTAAAGAAPADAHSDILNALLALGYNEKEALRAMKDLAPDTGVSAGIREALKLLAKV